MKIHRPTIVIPITSGIIGVAAFAWAKLNWIKTSDSIIGATALATACGAGLTATHLLHEDPKETS